MATELGGRISEVRAAEGLSQAEFARRVGVSRSYLSEVENEKGKAPLELIVGIATAFPRVSLKWLLTGEGSKEGEGVGSFEQWTHELAALESAGIVLPDRSDSQSDKPPTELSWPLTQLQEAILESFYPAFPLLGSDLARSYFSPGYERLWQIGVPIAITYEWSKAALHCEATHVRLYHFRNDDLAPLVPRGSYGFVSLDETTFSQPGYYLVVSGHDLEVWAIVQGGPAAIKAARGDILNRDSYRDYPLQADGVTIAGRVLWLLAPVGANLRLPTQE